MLLRVFAEFEVSFGVTRLIGAETARVALSPGCVKDWHGQIVPDRCPCPRRAEGGRSLEEVGELLEDELRLLHDEEVAAVRDFHEPEIRGL